MNHSTAAIAALPTAMVRNLSTIGYSRGWTLYLYRTEDERHVVEMPGYFDDLAVLLATGYPNPVPLPGSGRYGSAISCWRRSCPPES